MRDGVAEIPERSIRRQIVRRARTLATGALGLRHVGCNEVDSRVFQAEREVCVAA